MNSNSVTGHQPKLSTGNRCILGTWLWEGSRASALGKAESTVKSSNSQCRMAGESDPSIRDTQLPAGLGYSPNDTWYPRRKSPMPLSQVHKDTHSTTMPLLDHQ